jgi:TPP-dependent indolepyruvate ferredoxin oxidoreductase alpha subunit
MSIESNVLTVEKEIQNNIFERNEVPQTPIILNGNEAAARAIIDIGFDGEGYYPITPSSEVGEYVSRHVANGKTDISFIVGTSELAALGIVTEWPLPAVVLWISHLLRVYC